MTATSPLLRKFVQLPRSSTRLQKTFAHVKLLDRVRSINSTIAFEGRIYAPGANISTADLGRAPVVLECVGPVGKGEHRIQREVLWILWRFDWDLYLWTEIARAQSANADWALVLREPALRALRAEQPGLLEVVDYCRKLSTASMEEIDAKIAMEDGPVKISVLSAIYEQVAGRIAMHMGG